MYRSSAMLVALITGAIGVPATAQLLNGFDTDIEDWITWKRFRDVSRPPEIGIPGYSQDGGVPGGHLVQVENLFWYFEAPERYRGDRSGLIGSVFRFSMAASGPFGIPEGSFDAVWIEGPAGALAFPTTLETAPGADWTLIEAPMQPEQWLYSADFPNDLTTATAAQFEAVLSDVESFRIKGDVLFGEELVWLDSIGFSQAPMARSEQRKVLSSFGVAGGQSGSAVAMSRGQGLIGNFANASNNSFVQRVETFDVESGVIGAELLPDPRAPGGFGFSAAMFDGGALVGSPLTTGFQDGTDGSVILFPDVDGVGPVGGFPPVPDDSRSLFGWALALAEQTALVSVPLDDTMQGVVRVFDRDSLEVLAELRADDETVADGFGLSLAVNGARLALVGAPLGVEENARGGSAYLFDATTGAQLARFRLDAPEIGDEFGWDVALTEDYAFVAAPLIAGGEASEVGAVFVYDLDTLELVAELRASDRRAGARFGESIAANSGFLVVGAGDGGPAKESGAAYVFDVSTMTQITKLVPSDAAAGDRFGTDVALEGAKAIIGAPGDDQGAVDAGAVYVFDIAASCSDGDIASPFGIVDMMDIDVFVTGFIESESAVDFVEPFGIVDLDDLDHFLRGFLAGCP